MAIATICTMVKLVQKFVHAETTRKWQANLPSCSGNISYPSHQHATPAQRHTRQAASYHNGRLPNSPTPQLFSEYQSDFADFGILVQSGTFFQRITFWCGPSRTGQHRSNLEQFGDFKIGLIVLRSKHVLVQQVSDQPRSCCSQSPIIILTTRSWE